MHSKSSNFQIRTLRDSLPIVSALSWFRFVLADFGLSKEQVQARTLQKGSPLFIAAEICIPGAQQTYKVDSYSLGATMLAIEDAGKTPSNQWRKKRISNPDFSARCNRRDFVLWLGYFAQIQMKAHQPKTCSSIFGWTDLNKMKMWFESERLAAFGHVTGLDSDEMIPQANTNK